MDRAVPNGASPRRERLKQEREARILDAAESVFARKGFQSATIHEIAEVADVADGTIYNYFTDKADLLIGIMTRLAQLEHLPEELAQAGELPLQDLFVAMMRDRLARLKQEEQMLLAVLPEVWVNDTLRELFYQQYVRRIAGFLEQYLREQVELGHVRPVDVPLTVRIVQSLLVGLLFLNVLGDVEVRSRWEEVPQFLGTLLFEGVGVSGER